jgi:hypothetical protein
LNDWLLLLLAFIVWKVLRNSRAVVALDGTSSDDLGNIGRITCPGSLKFQKKNETNFKRRTAKCRRPAGLVLPCTWCAAAA